MPGSDSSTPALNIDVAERFREAADLLEAQKASPFRVRAYRQAQWTVVTETSGDLTGRRVVRGREADCRAYYDEQTVED